MMGWINRHKVALGYVLVAGLTAAAALAAAWFYPEAQRILSANGYEMEAPGWLWLAAAIPLLWFVRLHSLTDLPFAQQLFSTLLRSAMILALALSLTRITHISHEKRKAATVMIVDVSESVADAQLEEAHEALQALWDQKGENLVRLVTFAESPEVVPLTADEHGKLPPIARPAKGGLASDLQQAMRLAYGLYPPGFQKRLVIVTDGNETTGNALAEAGTAQRLGISVSYRSLPNVPPRPEMMVTSIDVPTDIEINVPFDASATITANHSGRARCTLTMDKLVAGTKEIDYAKGTEQAVDFDELRIRDGGEHAFRVDCEPVAPVNAPKDVVASLDRFTSNNHFEASRFVEEKKRLLYVEGEALYSKSFRDALKDDFEVEVRGAGGLPKSLKEAQRFKAIVVSDVPRQTPLFRENMTYGQMKLLHEYAEAGGLLLFTGGPDSLGPGGYTNTYLERQVLPVTLEVEHQQETPRLAMVIVLDRSGSMQGRKLELAKKAARETLDVLGKDDKIGVVAFDSQPYEAVRLQGARNVSLFDSKIKTLNSAGGTDIYRGLERGYDMLKGVEAQVKHVIILTDGQSPHTGIYHLVEQASQRKITTSSIAIGSGSDRALLEEIAHLGNGRYYFTESAEAIPKLFVDETKQVTRDAVVADPITAVLQPRFAGLRFLKGVDVRRAPSLSGYVTTQAKKSAEVILKTTGLSEPLLVRWKRGAGWVYVWTSDVKNRWASKWLRWAGFAPFWRQLVKDGLPEVKKDKVFPIEVLAARHKLTISTDAIDDKDQWVSGITSKATVTGPAGEKHEVVLSQTAAGRYEAEVPVSAYGPYLVDVVHEQGGKKLAVSRGRVAYPYAEEHLKFDPDLSRVEALARATGGTRDPTPAALWKVEGDQLTRKAPAWHWFLYGVIAVFVIDVLLRRVRLWPAKTLKWGARV